MRIPRNFKILSIYDPEEILPIIEGSYCHPKKVELNDIPVTINSLKLTCFKRKGLTCVKCGIEARSFYLVEEIHKDPLYNNFSLQAFAIKDGGKRVLMTIDHIIPKSKGGSKGSIRNVQPMCNTCNLEKDNKIEDVMDV